MEENKIAVAEYIEDPSRLELTYIPFDNKMAIVSHTLHELVKAVGGMNTSLLRRISTEVFIESISNIDMNAVDENGLKGFDQLCLHHEMDNLKQILGTEYAEFERILNEYVADYIRVETNPAVTIQKIYEQAVSFGTTAMEMISEKIQGIDVEGLAKELASSLPKAGDQQ